MSDMTVATTILEQLGGRRFVVMTGCRNFVGGGNVLTFRVGHNDKGIRHVRITLMPSDTYKMEFIAVGHQRVHTVEDVYFDQLEELFTQYTGLYTRL